jgi:hypothetical protein
MVGDTANVKEKECFTLQGRWEQQNVLLENYKFIN